MAYLIRRKAVYYLNLKLPKHLFPRCHTLRLSLNIRHRQSALFLAASIVQRLHGHLSEPPLTDLQTLRGLCSQWGDSAPTPAIPVAPRATSTAPLKVGSDSPTLATLSKLYISFSVAASGIWGMPVALSTEPHPARSTSLLCSYKLPPKHYVSGTVHSYFLSLRPAGLDPKSSLRPF